MRLDMKPTAVVLGAIVAWGLAAVAAAQHTGTSARSAAPAAATRPPVRISEDELHRHGGVPRGWKFTLPAGDARAGREVFAKLECYKCHEAMPDFPRGQRSAGEVGPELGGMGDHHPAEYFAESIVDPNAVLVEGPGWIGSDGRSIMPDYKDSLTVAELVDLVAYLKSLTGGDQPHHGPGSARERTAEPYRVRLEYAAGGHSHHGAPHHGGKPSEHARHHGGGHLMVFVTDAQTGEAIPYLPVSVVIAARKAPARTVRLAPMIGGGGFHYGADVALPPETTKLTVSLGAAALKTMGPAAGRFAKPVTLSFDWSD